MYFSIAFGSAMCLGIVVVACQRWRRNASGEADVFAAKITGVAARLPLLDGEAGHGAASAWAPRATLLDPPAALPQAGRGAAASGRSAAARAARAARAVPPPPQTPRAPASAADVCAVELKTAHVEAACNHFISNNLVNTGTFAQVFRGTLHGGRHIIVKLLQARLLNHADHPRSCDEAFRAAMSRLGKLRHAHIVAVLGFCHDPALATERGSRILVMERCGTSLEERLNWRRAAWHSTPKPALTWAQRFDVAADVARALEYLHAGTSTCVVHGDLTSCNVLLCHQFGRLVAKVTNFGTVQLAPRHDTGATGPASWFPGRTDQPPADGATAASRVTLPAIGTPWYMAPECAAGGTPTTKSDAFAFGVVLLELITGKMPVDDADCPLVNQLMPVISRERPAVADLLPAERDLHAGKEWTHEQLCNLALVARRFLATSTHERCDVSMLLPELDELAGRKLVRRAGPDARYDTNTGKLVRLVAQAPAALHS